MKRQKRKTDESSKSSRKAKKSKVEEEDFGDDESVADDADVAPKSSSAAVTDETIEDEFGAKDYRKIIELKADHSSRPLWVVS